MIIETVEADSVLIQAQRGVPPINRITKQSSYPSPFAREFAAIYLGKPQPEFRKKNDKGMGTRE